MKELNKIDPQVGHYYRHLHQSMVDPLTIPWIYITKVTKDDNGWFRVDCIIGYDEHPFIDSGVTDDSDDEYFEECECECDCCPLEVKDFFIFSEFDEDDNRLDELTEEEFFEKVNRDRFNSLL